LRERNVEGLTPQSKWFDIWVPQAIGGRYRHSQ